MEVLLFSGENYTQMLLNDLYSCRNIPLNIGETYQSIFFAGKVMHTTFLAMASI